MRTTTRTLTPTALLLLSSACAYDPEPSADEDLLARMEALEESKKTLEERIAELELQVSNGITLLTASRTVTVSDVAELDAALDELDRYRLARDVTYTIELADGTYSFTSPLVVNHPDGDRLEIMGASQDRDAVILSFTGSSGVVVEGNRTLGYLGYITLDGDSSAVSAGVDVGEGSSVGIGPLSVKGFSYGVRARENAAVTDLALNGSSFEISSCNYGIYSTTSAYVGLNGPVLSDVEYGVAAEEAGSAYAPSAQISAAEYGIFARSGGAIFADDASVSDPTEIGVYADRGAFASVTNATVSGGKQGFVAASGSTLIASNGTASNHEQSGFVSSWGAYLEALDADSSGNGLHGYATEGAAVMYANYATSTENAGDGFYATGSSHINSQYCEVADNNGYEFEQTYQGTIKAVGCSISSSEASDFLESGDGDTYIYI